MLSRRTLVLGASALSTAARNAHASVDDLANDVAELVMLGFTGSSPKSPSAQRLAHHAAAGRVKNVFFVLSNVGPSSELNQLISLFRERTPGHVHLAIDHEGGVVQRLGAQHGFTALPRPIDVARTYSALQAEQLYAKAAREFAASGFDINFAPVVDLYQAANPGIGEYGRSYSSDPAEVERFARIFIQAFESAGIICTLKHFPGLGKAITDSHDTLPDITKVWSDRELEPFSNLLKTGHARIIMGGHARLASIEADAVPTTLSRAVTHELLREKLGFAGVIMTDDIDMVAISRKFSRKNAFLRALVAGNDLIMIRNEINHDPSLPATVVEWTRDAITAGLLSRQDVTRAADRVRNLKLAVRRNGAG